MPSTRSGYRFPLPSCVMALALCLGQNSVQAQNPAPAAPMTAPPAVAVLSAKPLWQDLTVAQQQALSPLAQLWPRMSEGHKRKWLAISQNFAQLSETEKTTLQGRMREWTALTPQQRSQARLNFADAKQLTQDELRTKWEAYQALSPEEKQKLAAQKPPKQIGVAAAVRPVPADKLTPPPPASGTKALPRIASHQVAPATLLPTTTPASLPVQAPAPSVEPDTSAAGAP